MYYSPELNSPSSTHLQLYLHTPILYIYCTHLQWVWDPCVGWSLLCGGPTLEPKFLLARNRSRTMRDLCPNEEKKKRKRKERWQADFFSLRQRGKLWFFETEARANSVREERKIVFYTHPFPSEIRGSFMVRS